MLQEENKQTSYFYKAETTVIKRHDSDSKKNYFNISYFHSVCLSR